MASFDEILERTQWDFFWVPEDRTIVDRPELAYLSCPRDLSSANLVLRTREHDDYGPAIDEVRAAHAGRTSRWFVMPTWDSAGLVEALACGGYELSVEHDAAVVSTGLEVRGGDFEVRPVTTWEEFLDWAGVADRSFPAAGERTPESQRRHGFSLCTGPNARVARYVAYDGGEPIAAGGLSIYDDMSFGLLWAGATVPEARGRGAYRSILAARIAHARARGLGHVGLYAKSDTSSPVVVKAGFTLYGKMNVWECVP